jgi:DNA-binding NarL/FixJ family response regulator
VIRVVIADDEAIVRSGLRLILEGHEAISVVAEATDGARAIELVRRHRPDVVLMDIRMPHVDGLEATRRLAADPSTQEIRVLVLTTFDVDEYVFEALRAGARGFLLKEAPPEQLVAAIQLIAAEDALLAPARTRRLIEEHIRPPVEMSREELSSLTPREVEVLKLVARGLSNDQIADQLIVGENTIRTHLAHILSKLGVRTRVQAVVVAYESGLVRPGSYT